MGSTVPPTTMRVFTLQHEQVRREAVVARLLGGSDGREAVEDQVDAGQVAG
ncbi:MAG: hypothetical protein JWP53_3804 [Conexibacter sp.]|jgi:hypothetical protein|nr:hypothetical protein [Conexibacter sp.]